MEEQEAYRILKLEYGAEPHKVKSAYRKMALKLHPDRNATLEFGKITNAHNGKESGQEIPHVHVHLIPRSKNDGAGPVHSMFGKNTITKEQTEQAYNAIRSA